MTVYMSIYHLHREHDRWLTVTSNFLAAFSIGALISGVSLGVLADKHEKSRTIVLILNICSIIGNFMYFLGINQWVLISGRFIAGELYHSIFRFLYFIFQIVRNTLICDTGLGGGIGSLAMAEIAKGTRVAERARVLAICFGARQTGLALGPVYNLIMGQNSLDMGFIVLSETNFAGFFMTIVWIVIEGLLFLSYFDAGMELKNVREDSLTDS
jgi:MFS family permease